MSADVKELLSLEGKVAMVTGGSQNFGLEIASGLIEAGADVIITSRETGKAEKRAFELSQKYSRPVHGMGMDLLDEKR